MLSTVHLGSGVDPVDCSACGFDFGLTASYPAFTCAKNGLFSIAMIAILTGSVGFVVLNAGRSPCGGAAGGADSVFEDCFAGVSSAVVHPASNAIAATAAPAKVIARFTGTPCRSACRPRVGAATSIGHYRARDSMQITIPIPAGGDQDQTRIARDQSESRTALPVVTGAGLSSLIGSSRFLVKGGSVSR